MRKLEWVWLTCSCLVAATLGAACGSAFSSGDGGSAGAGAGTGGSGNTGLHGGNNGGSGNTGLHGGNGGAGGTGAQGNNGGFGASAGGAGAGGAGTGGAGTGGAGTGGVGGAPQVVVCGQQLCALPDNCCCFTLHGGSGGAQPSPPVCAASDACGEVDQVPIHCDGPEDCPPNLSQCCQSLIAPMSVQCAATCDLSPTICHGTYDCSGHNCCAVHLLGNIVSACQLAPCG